MANSQRPGTSGSKALRSTGTSSTSSGSSSSSSSTTCRRLACAFSGVRELAYEHKATPKWKLWLFTTDHKRIGVLYMLTAFCFFFLAGLAALTIRSELYEPGPTFIKQSTFNELFSLHGVTMIFLWIIPVLVGGFGNYFLPLQIGAKDMSFPRMNALSYWIYLSAGSMM